MKAILIFSTIFLLLSGCSQKDDQTGTTVKTDSIAYGKSSSNSLSEEELNSSRVYLGLLPQGDSQQIQTTLYITKDYQQYQLIKKFPGQSDSSVTRGKLNTERGFEEDRNAVVYVLDYDKGAAKQSFFVKLTGDSTVIFKLATDKKKMLRSYPFRKVEK